MKIVRYFFTILILAGILNLFKMYNLIDFNFVKYSKVKSVEINEEIVFQTEYDDEIKDINNMTKSDFQNFSLKESEIRRILKYREFLGVIDDISKMKKILNIDVEIKTNIKNISLDKYRKYKIEKLTNKDLTWLGFNKNEIKEIKKILKEKEGKRITEFDFIGKVNEEIIKKHIDFKEGD